QGVLKAMLLTKLKKCLAVLLVAAAAGWGAGAAALSLRAQDPPPAEPVDEKPAAAAPVARPEQPRGRGREQALLPTTPSPAHALANGTADGDVEVRRVETGYRRTKAIEPGTGREVMVYIPDTRLATHRYGRGEVEAYDTKGKRVGAEELVRRLRK